MTTEELEVSPFADLKKAIQDKYVNTVITFLLVIGSLYLATISVFERHIFHPLTGDNIIPSDTSSMIFSLLVILVCSVALGWIVSIVRLPPLFGCLLIGIAFGNIPLLVETFHVSSQWDKAMRLAALAVISVRWGLGIDFNTTKKRPLLPVGLGLLTPLAEVAAIAVCAHLLFGITIPLAILAGFLLAAVSPAVTVPVMLHLTTKERGTERGIPSLVLAVSSIDNLLCIAAFTTILTIVFSQESLAVSILFGILQVISGVGIGVIFGCLLWFFPLGSARAAHAGRVLLLAVSATAAVFGGSAVGWIAAGIICAILVSCTAGIRWKKENLKAVKEIEKTFATLWDFIFMPLLFALLGMKFKFDQLSTTAVLVSLALIGIGLLARAISAMIVPAGMLKAGETFFVMLSLLPKATVQAAFGPALLMYIPTNPALENDIRTIVTACVLTIIITAPLGQLLLQIMAPVLLAKNSSVVVPIRTENGIATELPGTNGNGFTRSTFIQAERADNISLRM